MSGYVITEDFIELKRLYEEGNIDKFEKKISSYTADDLREFASYFSLDISSKDEYYNVKIISEITYNLVLKERFTKDDRFIILALKHWGRCVYLSCEKGLWKDVIKYGNLIYEYTLDNDEKWDIQDYLSRAYFYQGNYEKELFYRKRILDQNDYLSLYNYALALFHNQRYEEARLYNQLCIEQYEFPPAFRNQAHISIVLDNDYVKAYDFCDKGLEVYYKREKDFPLVYPIIYLLQQIFICGLCSSDELYKRLELHKEKGENGIKCNDKLAEKIYMVRFIEICSLTNRAIYNFENVEFRNSINLFHKAQINIDAEKKIIDEKIILNTYYDKINEVVSLYILFIQIINSLKSIFNDNITVDGIRETIEKVSKIRFILYNRVDNDFTYDYKKLILLYVEYLFIMLNYIFNNNENVDGINASIEKICFNKTNYIKSNLLNCLYELKQIGESYEVNKGLQFFDNDYKKMYIEKLKEAIQNFCINMKKINFSFNACNDNVSDKNTEFCNQIIKAIYQMKLHRPDYVRNYITNPSVALQEENFRDTIGFFFSAVFDVSSEEWRKEGRTDLIIKMNDNGQRIIEFKIWGRNDYKEVVQQITERYLTEFDSDGYIIMVNGNKNSITDKYIEYITDEKAGYIDNSLNKYTISNFDYYETRHKTAFSEYKIFHFIYNIFD